MAYVFDSPCRYQVIAGRDFLRRTGIDLTFKKNHITWMDWSIPMKSPYSNEASYNAIIDEYNWNLTKHKYPKWYPPSMRKPTWKSFLRNKCTCLQNSKMISCNCGKSTRSCLTVRWENIPARKCTLTDIQLGQSLIKCNHTTWQSKATERWARSHGINWIYW